MSKPTKIRRSQEEKDKIFDAIKLGELSIKEIADKYNVAVGTLYAWKNKIEKESKKATNESEEKTQKINTEKELRKEVESVRKELLALQDILVQNNQTEIKLRNEIKDLHDANINKRGRLRILSDKNQKLKEELINTKLFIAETIIGINYVGKKMKTFNWEKQMKLLLNVKSKSDS